MKAFVSWSGGKDCLFALYHFIQNKNNTVIALVNMCSDDGDKSSSHGLDKTTIRRQAESLKLPIIQNAIENNNYEESFKKTISKLIEQHGIDTGVFGDIYLEAHKKWIERVCSDLGINAVFPLWGHNTIDLLKDFVNTGFKTIIVSVRKDKLPKPFLGKVIDKELVSTLISMNGIDPCAENGEYHSFVFDGPLFNYPIELTKGKEHEDEKHWFLGIN